MEKVDKETKDILEREQKIWALTEMEEWKIVRQMLADKITQLQMNDSLDLEQEPLKLSIEMKANRAASNILLDWLREVEGTAQKSSSDREVFKRPSYIVEA